MVLFSRISPLTTRRRAILSQTQNVAYLSYHIDGVFGDDLLDGHVKYNFQDSCPRGAIWSFMFEHFQGRFWIWFHLRNGGISSLDYITVLLLIIGSSSR
jgi:hypothetical protein